MGHHDLFFKNIFSDRENVADFLRHTLAPELTREMDLNTLVIENGSHVDTGLAENFSDMVYTCRFSGIRIRVALLFEHKSAPDNNLPFQLHRYMGNLWQNNIKQKQSRLPVIPIVFYHGPKPWIPGTLMTRFNEFPEAVKSYIPDFQFVFIDLSTYSNEAIKAGVFNLASLRIALLIMKNIFNQEQLEHHLTQFLEIGRIYFQEAQGLKFLESVVNYILQATEIETDVLVQSVALISKRGGEIAMTTAEKIRQEGLREGRREGRQEGRREGSYKTMVSLVRNAAKNGLPEETIARIANLDITLVRKILNNEPVDIPLHLLTDNQ